MAISPSSGPTAGGTPITIVGSDFVEGVTVSFGDTLATDVIVADRTLMIATTPPHAPGVVDVVVISPDGQTSTLSGYTYTTDPPPAEPPPSTAPTIYAVTASSGPVAGGTRITITGNAFAEGASVALGNTPATNVIVASSIAIMAITPPHDPGPVDATVTNPDGQIATLSAGYTYTTDEPLPTPPSSPEPTIQAIAPSSGSITGGTRVTIRGSAFADGATVTLGDVAAPAAIVMSETVIVATTPSHAEGPVDVIVTNPDGRIATLGGGYAYIGEQPPMDATIAITSFGVSPKDIEIPIGARVTFVNNDSRPHNIQSDPHPVHTDCPPINEIGFLNPGESRQTGRFLTAAACGYHDHNQASNQALRGQIVIR